MSNSEHVPLINKLQEDNAFLLIFSSGSSAAPSKAMKAAILNLLLTHQFSCESLIGKRPRHREDAIVITISTPNNVDI